MVMEHDTQGSQGNGGRLGADEPQYPTDALRDAANAFAELKDYVSYYLAAKSDSIKVTLRNVGLYAGLGIVGLIAAGTFVAMACALLCLGIAYGLTALFHGHAWLAYLVTGIVLLGVIFGGAWIGLSAITRSSRQRTVKKYEQWQQQQRARFGTDVKHYPAHTRK